ncbi:unnamed protein product [Porites evermanni]|uniref:HEPN domain-containing protein n=1 Tax=Porites evermanni TaxID=104178 RepID=A0ABN8SQ13_9CNID|nr:unnamed protein product [Porites evermanni]
MASLLSNSLPPGWSQGKTILWYHGSDSCNHPGLDWLELVWNYLRVNFATNDELRGFTGLPLIPHDMSQEPISLARLQQPSKIVLKSLYDESFDETLIQSLKDLGLVIIQECPSYLTLHPAVINAFIYPPSPHGVLKALSACSSVVESNKHSLTDEGKRSLRKFFSKESTLEPQAKQLLRTLPVFETLNKSFVSAEEDVCAAPPEDSYPVAPRRVLIDVTHDDSKRLAHLLDIRCLSPIEFFLEIVFPDVRGGNYSNGEIDRIMGFVMERFQVYASEDARFEEVLTNLPFVPSENRRERAMDLFDPGVELLKRMLAEEDVFPVGEQYTNPTALVVLKKLGLKSEKEISADDLYRSARKISQMPNLEEAKRKSATVLSYLDSYSTKLQQTVSGVTLTQLLRDVPWVSEVNERPFGVPVNLYSTEETSKAHFYKPTEVTSEDKVNLIGTVKPIVRVDSSSQLAKCFGWDKMPDALDVVQHLRTVVTHYTQDKKPYYISVVNDIYSFLDQTANIEVIKEALQGIENSIWIWNGDGFSSPDVVLASRPPIDLTPYICSLPSEVLQFSNLFSRFGMREHCDALLFVQVLQLIKQKYESGHEYPSTEVKRDLQLSTDILNEIKPNVGQQLPSEIQEKVLIPTHVEGDSYVRLAPIKDCMYCDHEWLEDGIPVEEENQCFFVHQNISNSTAELFQVRTLRNQLLEADEIGDEFGQEEKLTRRLNKILEEYTDGFSVPKELIQNADDAGATEVRFLYDQRTNEDAMTCLIDEGMKECQGPALWVYNNAEFRDDDFENITKLNGGTKRQETEKIGKFGLGFNTVYNLTDVPMFLSRNYFVIFDPNTFYLGKAITNKRKPGIKIDVNKNPERKRRLRNQFKPFNGIFGCDLLLNKNDNSFQGTLFRFPLRTKRQAVRSEIKQDYYGHNQMRELLEIFVRGAKTLLLFTQNVRQVSIFHLPRDSTELTQPKLMFQVTKALSHSGIMRELSVPMKLPLHQSNVSTDDLHLLKQCNFLRASSQVLKHNEDMKETNDYLLRSAITINIKATLTECGRLFFEDKISLHNSSEVWFVASSMGKGQAMQFSMNDRSLLPAAAVAVKLLPQESEKFVPEPVVSHAAGGKLHHNGSVFCYLPLPIHSGLPVHINGTFAVASNRRHLKQKTEDDKACAEVEWNNVLLKDSVCSAYLDLLEDIKSTATTYCFHSLWPRACDIEPYFEPLARSFYQKVASGGYSLFSDGDTWVGINQVVFLEPYFRRDQRVGDISVAVLQKMVTEQEVVVDLPAEIVQSFIDYGLGEKIQLKAYDRSRFFRELFFPNIGSVPADKRDELILFALDDSNGEFDELIKSYACIPASPNGKILKRPMDLVHPNKSTASLFHSEDERFPFGTIETFLDSVRLAKLEQLGMKTEKGITADDLYHSANNIPRMVKSSEAKQKSENIMTFLDSNPMILQQNVSGEPLALLLRDIPWISVMEETPFCLPKSLYSLVQDREVPFYKPTEVTSKDKVNLVGTVKPIVRVDSSSHLAKCFGWDKMPDALDVVQHLKTVVSHYTPDEKQYYISIVKDIYSFLDQAADPEAIEGALEGIKNSNWIWNGDGFSSPDAVLAERPPIDLTPFICSLPSEVVQFSNLFSKFGMSSHCDALFLVQILHVIKKKYESGLRYPTSDVKRDLQLCADILNEIKPDVGKQLALEIQEKVLIPTHVEGDSYVRLAPVKDCMYCDHEWLEDSTPVDEERYFFVHPNIPNSTAELLQVRTLRNQLLEADEIGDEFGQEEKLTCRLNRLLEEYTDGFSVPKELIQNADDAGATEVRFLYDERANEDAMTCLIDEGMKECQGPALWVYNDAEFKDEDFRNITKLNGSSKEQENEKIGKFGLGFNTVYNLTDVPMFLSRNYFVIFDPNTFYLGKAIKNKRKPGIKIDVNKNPERKRRFRNQFKPFNGIFGCDLRMNKAENSFPGTLFRFPLRTKAQAVRSEIKQVHYDNNQMKELLEIFVRGAKKLLLFTQNVRRVSIFHLLGESSEAMQPTLMFQVTKSLSQTGICRELSFPLTLPSHLGNLSKDEQYLLKQSNFLRASSEVAKHAGDCKATRNYLLRSAFTFNITSNVTECGRCFFEDKSPLESIAEVWFIASSMGKGQAMQYSLNDRSLLPAAAVAVQLITQENEKFAPKPVVRHATGGKSHHNGTVFCYLPLPIHSGLPVHINGAFAVASNRRDLKQKTEDDKACVGVEWNDVLFTDSVCEAYLDLLEDMKSRATMYPFHTLWPRECDMEPRCEPLVRSFYRQVATGGYSLFSDGNRWVDISQVVCLDPYFRQDKDVGGISYTVLQMLVSKDKVVIDLPVDIFQSFAKYGLEEHIRLKTYDKGRFLRELFFPNILSIPQDMRDKLVLNALDDTKGQFDELIATHACIPASPGGKTLKCPAELIHPKKATASLFQIEDEKFPFGTDDTFLDCVRLTKLEQLGMVADDPPWGMFEERAKSVGILNEESSKGALERAKALISLLERKLYPGAESNVPEGVQENLLQIKFLPVFTKPEHFPLFWKGGDLRPEKRAKLLSPEEAFVESAMYLVCCSEPLVDGNIYISLSVKKFLQLDKKATIKHIIAQLDMASCVNDDLNSVQFEQVKTTFVEAYKYLQAALNENQIDENEVRGIFEGKKFILAGREFVDTRHVAFELPVDCCPYLHKLPEDLAKQFGNLMRSVGVKQVYEAGDFLSSLEQIKRAFGDAVLEKKILQAAVHLACQLGKCLTDCCVSDGKQQTIYLPDSQGIMRPVSKLCIKDCHWISDEKDVYYAESMIPHQICLKLGVKTRRAEALSRFAVGIPFGQKEKLTNRLRRLLQAYPCEKEILKELLQNADDAEATEICFIKDPRQHPVERVFEESWKPLQGPALCVYNNKPFTEVDIKGIQNLGEGSKGDDPNKTGQYGVGFNAVYHLTDAPSFASCGDEIGDVLCVFDPNCKYVPGATKWEPGRMFSETTKLKGDFVDVFSCYNEDHFSLRNATMFRFPLRTEEMAKDSEISNSPVTLETLQGMMESLKTELFEVLLFVNSVKKITMCDIDESGQVVNSYVVRAEMSEEDSLERQTFASYVKQIGRSFKQNPEKSPIQAEVRKCSYILTLKDSMENEEKWLIVQQIGFENHVTESIIDAYKNNDLGMLPRGGVACLLERKPALAQRTEEKKKAYCFLPLPVETDLPLHINGHFALDHEARRSLDSTGGYKTDWNNFLLSDVIASCYLTLLDKVRRFFNLPVSQSPEEVSVSFCRDELTKNIKKYEKLFPCAISSNQYWATLVKSVYQGMNYKRLRLAPVLRGYATSGATSNCQLLWLPLTGNGADKVFFNNLGDCDCFRHESKERLNEHEKKSKIDEKTRFENILLQTGFNLAAFSLSICDAAHKSGVQSCFVSPSAVMDFYKSFSGEIPLCRIGSLFVDVSYTPFKDVQTVVTVLKYCKESESFLGNLPGLPLLVTQDNHLQPFNAANRKFLSRHHHLLPQCKEMFVHDHIRTHIFGDAKSLEVSVFKHFDVQSFAANLHQALRQDNLNSSQFLKWNPDQVAEPNGGWVYRVWKFLDEQVESVLREERKRETETANRTQATPTPTIQVKETRITRTVLEPLSNCSILPCTETIPLPKPSQGNASGVVAEHYLVPLSLADSVLDFTSCDTTSKRLVEALRKLSVPELNTVVLSSTVSSAYTSLSSCRLAHQLVATINSPKLLLLALCQKIARNTSSLHGKLSSIECRTILEHFSNSVKDLDEGDILALRKLPLYEATHGGQVSLDNKSVCVVPVEVPHDGMEVLESVGDFIFLKSWSRLSALYEFMKFESVSSIDIYCKFILKYFSLFPGKARLVHLKHIRDGMLTQTFAKEFDKQRLLSCLENAEIIPSSRGNLVKASSFYDPEHEVFKCMLSDDMFPPEPFNAREWLPFLKTIGLIHEVSQDLFKTFALKIAHEGNTQPTKETEDKSKVLVVHLLRRNKVVDEGLLQAIRDIRFVPSAPVKQNLQAIHRPYCKRDDGKATYISFRGSVLAKHAEIVWTTAGLLPQWANPKEYQYLMHAPDWRNSEHYCNAITAQLGILAEPTVELVTSHCQNVSFQLEKENDLDLTDEQIMRRMKIMLKIYRFLEVKATSDSFARDQLKHTPCIVVEEGRRLVRVEQVVIELNREFEIQPFLYGLPAELVQRKGLFQYLGCASVAKVSHFAMVLDMLQEKCRAKPLDPNEKICALTAERGIFETLQDPVDGDHSFSSLNLPATRPLIKKDEGPSLPVLLPKSNEILFDDAPFYHERIKKFEQLFLVDLSWANVRCKKGFNYKDLIMLLPPAVRPGMLSSAVIEKFTDSSERGESFDLGAAGLLKRSVHSPQFCRGIIRLIRHTSRENQEKVDESVVATIKNRLQTIEIHGMSKIVTQLLYKGTTIPGSEMERQYFLEKVSKSSEEIWNVYVNAVDDAQKTSSAIALTLAKVISEACKGLLRDAALYIPTMLQSQPEEISSFLDMMKIHQDDSYDGEKGQILPQPGSYIPIAEQHLLNASFSYFKPGEYVGYEVDDPSLQLKDGDATYIYAVIIEEVSNPNTSLITKSYKINIGNDKPPKIVPATELYKFYRLQEIASAALVPSFNQGTNMDRKHEILKEITKTLEEAWRLPEDRRRQVVKRLFFFWHPDKNPGNEEFCTEVFQHIKNEIERLEREGWGRSERERSESYHYGGSYGAFFGFWETRAREYSSRRRDYQETYHRHYGTWGHGTRTWEVPPSFCETNPQPGQARRWFRQAEADLNAVVNDVHTGNASYEWACFKCHQAAEKALKAAQYATDAFKTKVHNLVQNSLMLDDSRLVTVSSQLEECVGDSTRMRYPDRLDYPKIPNDVYTEEDAHQALEAATEILQIVRSRVS